MEDFDKGAVAGSILSLAIYHIYTYSSVFCLQNENIQLSRNISNSFFWIQKHRAYADAASVTLAVQTLRNTILVSIFVGGSAFQYGFLFLNTPAPIFKDQVRALILSILLFSSFLCWANTIRYANHLAFCVGALEFQIKEVENRLKLEKERLDLQRSDDLEGGTDFETAIEDKFDGQRVVESSSTINPPSTQPHECQGKKKQSRIRRRRNVDEILHELKLMSVSMLSSFSLGFRLLFVSIPFAFYSAGPIALIIASSVILIFLYNIDHVEKSTYSFMGGLSDLRKNA